MKMTNFVKRVVAEAKKREFGDLEYIVINNIENRYDEIYDNVVAAGYDDYTYRNLVNFLYTRPRAGRVAVQKYFLSIIPHGDLNYILFNN